MPKVDAAGRRAGSRFAFFGLMKFDHIRDDSPLCHVGMATAIPDQMRRIQPCSMAFREKGTVVAGWHEAAVI